MTVIKAFMAVTAMSVLAMLTAGVAADIFRPEVLRTPPELKIVKVYPVIEEEWLHCDDTVPHNCATQIDELRNYILSWEFEVTIGDSWIEEGVKP